MVEWKGRRQSDNAFDLRNLLDQLRYEFEGNSAMPLEPLKKVPKVPMLGVDQNWIDQTQKSATDRLGPAKPEDANWTANAKQSFISQTPSAAQKVPSYAKEETPGQGVSDLQKKIGEIRTEFGLDRVPEKFTPEQQKKIDESSILGEFGKGVKRGGKQVAGSFTADAGLAASVVGADETARGLMKSATSMQKVKPEDQAVIDDIEKLYDNPSLGNFTRWALGNIGEQTPVLGSLAAGGLLFKMLRAGAVVAAPGTMAKLAASKVVPGAVATGVGATGFGLETGGTASELFDATDEIHVVPSVIAGAVKTGLETLTPLAVAKRFKLPLGIAEKYVPNLQSKVNNRLAKFLVGGAKVGSVEGLTELTQEAVDVVTREFVDENYDPTAGEVFSRLMNAAASGYIVGHVLGGGLDALDKTRAAEDLKKPKSEPNRNFSDLEVSGYEAILNTIKGMQPEGFVAKPESEVLGEEDADGNILEATPTTSEVATPGKGTPVSPITTEAADAASKGKKSNLKFRKGEVPQTDTRFQKTEGLDSGVYQKVSPEGTERKSIFNKKAEPKQEEKKGLKFRTSNVPSGGRVQVPDLTSGRFTKTVNDGGVARTTRGVGFRPASRSEPIAEPLIDLEDFVIDQNVLSGKEEPFTEPVAKEPVSVETPQPTKIVAKTPEGKIGFKKKRGPQTIQIGKKGEAATAEQIAATADQQVSTEVNDAQNVRKVVEWISNEYSTTGTEGGRQRVIEEIGQGKLAQVIQEVKNNPNVTEADIRSKLKGTFFAGESAKILNKVKEIFTGKPIPDYVRYADGVNKVLEREPEFRYEALAQMLMSGNITEENFDEAVYVITENERINDVQNLYKAFTGERPAVTKKDLLNDFDGIVRNYKVYREVFKDGKPLDFKNYLKIQLALNIDTIHAATMPQITMKSMADAQTAVQRMQQGSEFDDTLDDGEFFDLAKVATIALDDIATISRMTEDRVLYAIGDKGITSGMFMTFDTGAGTYARITQKSPEKAIYYAINTARIDDRDMVASLSGLPDVGGIVSGENGNYIGRPEHAQQALNYMRLAAETWKNSKYTRSIGNITRARELQDSAEELYHTAISLGLRIKPTNVSGVILINPHSYAQHISTVAPPRINITAAKQTIVEGVFAKVASPRPHLDLDKLNKNKLYIVPNELWFMQFGKDWKSFSAVNKIPAENFWAAMQQAGVTYEKEGLPPPQVIKDLKTVLTATSANFRGYGDGGRTFQNATYTRELGKAGIRFPGSYYTDALVYDGTVPEAALVSTDVELSKNNKSGNFVPVLETFVDGGTYESRKLYEQFNVDMPDVGTYDSEYELANPKFIEEIKKLDKVVEEAVKKYKLGNVRILYGNAIDMGKDTEAFGIASLNWKANRFEIVINTEVIKDQYELVFTVMHELGHVITHRNFGKADLDTQHLIREEYLRDMQYQSQQSVANFSFTRSLSMGSEMYKTNHAGTIAKMHEAVSSAYYKDFDEWLANRIAQAFLYPNSPVSKFDKFITTTKNAIVSMINYVKEHFGFNATANEVVTAWLTAIENGKYNNQRIAEGLNRNIAVGPLGVPIKKNFHIQNSIFADDEKEFMLDVERSMNMAGAAEAATRFQQATAPAIRKWKKWYRNGLSIVQLSHLFPQVQELNDFVSLTREWDNLRSKWLAQANERLVEWRNLGQDQATKVSQLVFYISEMEYRTPAEVLAKVRRMPTTAEMNAAITQFGVSREGVRVFNGMTKDFIDAMKAFEEIWTLQAIKTISDPALRAQKIAEIRGEVAQMLAAPYFPHTRFGKYGITVRDTSGPRVKILEFQLAETEREQAEIAAELAIQYPGSTITQNVMPEDSLLFQGMPPFVQRSMIKLLGKYVTDPAQRQAMEQALGLYALKSAPTQSFRKRFLKRKKIAGWSEDAQRVYAQYFMGAAGHMARAQYEDPLKETIRSLQKKARVFPGNANTISNIANTLQMHLEAIFNPANEWAGMRAFAGLWYLGFSPAAAATNLLQIPTFTLPYLTHHFGTVAGTARIGRTVSTATRRLTSMFMQKRAATKAVQAGQTPRPLVWARGDQPKNSAFIHAMQDRFLDESITSDVAAAANISTVSRLKYKKGLKRAGSLAMQYGFILFRGTEKLNRFITFESAWDLAMRHPQTPAVLALQGRYPQIVADLQLANAANGYGWTDEHIRAYMFASEAVRASQFEYASYAKPNFLRGWKGAVLTFYTYVQSSLFFARYMPGGARSLLVMAAIGGLLGLPFGDDLFKIVKAIGYYVFGKDWDLEKAIREYYIEVAGENPIVPPDILLHGSARSGFGLPAFGDMIGLELPRIDLSASASMGHVIPGVNALNVGPNSSFGSNFGEMSRGALGAGINIPLNILEAMTDFKQPFTSLKRWEKAMPRGLRSLSKAGRYFINGEETNRAGYAVQTFDWTDPVQAAEIAATGLGFNLTRMSRQWDAINAVKEMDYIHEVRRSVLIANYYRATKSRDNDWLNGVREDIKQFNDEVPNKARRITNDTLQKSLKMRKSSERKFEKNLPPLKSQAGSVNRIKRLYPEATVVDEQEVE